MPHTSRANGTNFRLGQTSQWCDPDSALNSAPPFAPHGPRNAARLHLWFNFGRLRCLGWSGWFSLQQCESVCDTRPDCQVKQHDAFRKQLCLHDVVKDTGTVFKELQHCPIRQVTCGRSNYFQRLSVWTSTYPSLQELADRLLWHVFYDKDHRKLALGQIDLLTPRKFIGKMA